MDHLPTITSASFNIMVTPARVKVLLEGLRADRWLSTEDLLQIANVREHLRMARYVKENLHPMADVGLVKREQARGIFLYQLSDLGQLLSQARITRPQLYSDLIHFLFYVLYEEQQRQCTRLSDWSWIYQSTCRLLWELRPNVPTFSDQAAALNHKLLNEFPDFARGVHTDSPNAAVLWLRELDPPFLHGKGHKRRTYGRAWCSPELLLLGINRLYQYESLSYNTPLLLREQVWNELSQLCLMEVSPLEEVLEISLSTFPFLKIHSGEWGRSFILEQAISTFDILS